MLRCNLIAALVALAPLAAAADEFAAEVIECVPGPGQFINDATFYEPAETLGAPSGGGTGAPGNSSVMSLGGFGGSIVLRFAQTVTDDPGNYLGLDFIVYSNAFWTSGDPQRTWAEPAHVEIMPDVNGDGVPGNAPGEQWYLIPGSLLDDASTWREQTWDDVLGDPYPPANTDWFPWLDAYPYAPGGPCVIPIDEFGRYTTDAYELPVTIYDDPGEYIGIVTNPNATDDDPDNDHLEGHYGYAEMSPTLILGDLDADNVVDDPDMTAAEFYTVPDNPFRVGVTPGSGGGDALDIAWAVDPTTWQPAGLTGFDFLRLTSALDVVLGVMGEASPEIDAVANVRPVACPGDLDCDDDVDLVDLIELRNRLGIEDPQEGFTIPGDLEMDAVLDVQDLVRQRATYLGLTCD
jgi:hypothetical protein